MKCSGPFRAPDRGLDPGLGQALGVSDRQILAAAITVMDQLVSLGWCALPDGLIPGINHETGSHRGLDTPADDLDLVPGSVVSSNVRVGWRTVDDWNGRLLASPQLRRLWQEPIRARH